MLKVKNNVGVRTTESKVFIKKFERKLLRTFCRNFLDNLMAFHFFVLIQLSTLPVQHQNCFIIKFVEDSSEIHPNDAGFFEGDQIRVTLELNLIH